MKRVYSTILILLLTTIQVAFSQQQGPSPTLVYSIQDAAFDYNVRYVHSIDDVNNDGFKELLILGGLNDQEGLEDSANGIVYSGINGEELYNLDYNFDNNEKQNFLGYRPYTYAQLNDLDGDSIPDYAISDPHVNIGNTERDGAIYIFSGRSGILIRSHRSRGIRYGNGIESLGDIDQDGFEDYSASEESNKGYPRKSIIVSMYSGESGDLLAQITSKSYEVFDQRWSNGSLHCKGMDDLNGDGIPDLALSDVQLNEIRFVSGTVRGRYSTDKIPDQYIISRHLNNQSQDRLGINPGQQLVRLNDLDGDGLSELLYRTWAEPGGSRTDKLVALSPGTLKKVWEIDVDDEFKDLSIVEIGDFDRDGIADFIIGSARREITVISGKEGDVITQYSLDFTPSMLVSMGDLDGDGIHEIANSYFTWIDDDVDSISVMSLGPGVEPVDEVNLQILRTANGMTISLPGDTQGGTVQSSSDLVQWQDLSILSDSQPDLAIPKEQLKGARFFRLRYEAP